MLHLEQIRRRNGVSLQQVAETTKISTYFLRAIESEEFDKLPGGVFNTSYIRQYAAVIGFPEAKLLECYFHSETARQAEEQALVPVRKSLPVRWMNRLRSLIPIRAA
jgi:cytoskeletal protein RodZ